MSRLRHRDPAVEKDMQDHEIHVATEKARAGSTPHIVRYILSASLALAIIAMIVIVLSGTA
jgi:Flp pilus assembly protein TadB